MGDHIRTATRAADTLKKIPARRFMP